MKYLEYNLQCACVRWFRYQHPKLILFHIPNERKQSPQAGARAKASGVIAGIPDLFLCKDNYPYLGLFIEMKSEKGKQTELQKYMTERLQEAGYKVVVCNSFESFKNEVTQYIN